MWTLETAAIFQSALRMEAAKASKAAGRLRILSDSRDFPVQTQEVVDAMAGGPPSDPAQPSRMAVVVGSTLNRMQATRSIGSEHIRAFGDWDEARAWLLEA